MSNDGPLESPSVASFLLFTGTACDHGDEQDQTTSAARAALARRFGVLVLATIFISALQAMGCGGQVIVDESLDRRDGTESGGGSASLGGNDIALCLDGVMPPESNAQV